MYNFTLIIKTSFGRYTEFWNKSNYPLHLKRRLFNHNFILLKSRFNKKIPVHSSQPNNL